METRPVFERPPGPLRKIEELEAIVRARPGGGALLDDFAPIADEAQFLVQHNRRVGAAWQRNAGPAFARAVVDSGFDENAEIPRSIGGATLEGLLLAMADVLQQYGSLPVRRAIAEHAPDVLRGARRATTLGELVDALAASRARRAAAAGDHPEGTADA